MKQEYGIKSLFEDDFLKRDLGNSFLSSPDIAITELVANAWDAGATEVRIIIPSTYDDFLSIDDNGIGMDINDFQNHWMKIRYNRLKEQGKDVVFPSSIDSSARKRKAYGKNGIGRHGLLCFNDNYLLVSKKEHSEKISYELTTSNQENPFYALPFNSEKAFIHGTSLSVKVKRNLPKVDEIRQIISSRFLYDPQFSIYINSEKLELSQLSGYLDTKEKDILLDDKNVHLKVHFVDTKQYKKSVFNGIAIWNSGRLVGSPSWVLGNKMIMDARHAQAKRFSFIVEANDLDDYIKEDWTGFKKLPLIDIFYDEIFKIVIYFLREYNLKHISDIKQQVTDDLKDDLKKSSLLVKYQVDEMITQTVTDNPQVSQNSILVAARAVINLGKASKGEELLAKLAQMSSEEIDSLNRLLSKWTVRDALTVLDEIDKRLTVIEAVRKLCDDKNTDELHVLHPLITEARWLFGPEYDTVEYQSNRQLQTVMSTMFKDKWDKRESTNFKKRPDLVIVGDSTLSLTGVELYDADMKMPKVKRLLLIELKRGGFEITRDERNQVGGYAEDLISNFKDTELQICAFVVGSKIADNITRQANFGDNDRIHLYVTTFSQLIDAAEHRLFGLRRKLACMYDDILGMDLYKQVQLNFK